MTAERNGIVRIPIIPETAARLPPEPEQPPGEFIPKRGERLKVRKERKIALTAVQAWITVMTTLTRLSPRRFGEILMEQFKDARTKKIMDLLRKHRLEGELERRMEIIRRLPRRR